MASHLEIKDLNIAVSETDDSNRSFFSKLLFPKHETHILLKDVNILVNQNEILGLIGESGSGKSLTIKTIFGLHSFLPGIVSGEVTYKHNGISASILNHKQNKKNSSSWAFEKLFMQQYNCFTYFHINLINNKFELPDNFMRTKPISIVVYNDKNDYKRIPPEEINMGRSIDLPQDKLYTNAFVIGFKKISTSFNSQIKSNLKRLKKEGSQIQGKEISLILQDPATFLNPHWRIERQINNLVQLYKMDADEKADVDKNLNELRLNYPQFLDAIPKELSGGQIQRAMILLSRLTKSNLLIADEPTTGLDVTLKLIVVEFFRRFKKSMIFVSHDLNMVRKVSDRINVMYNGEIIENCSANEFVSEKGHHPYAEDLIKIQNSDYKEFLAKEQPNRKRIKDFHGCKYFHQDCKKATGICEFISPPHIDVKNKLILSSPQADIHWVKCWDFLNE